MESSPLHDAHPPLERQILRLNERIEKTRDSLQNNGHTQIDPAIEQLTDLVESLTCLRRQVVAREVERENLLALAGIGQLTNSSLESEDVLRIVMDTIIRLTGAERGFLMLYNPEGELVIPIARNWEQATLEPSEFAISRTIVTRVITEGQPILTTDAKEDPRFDGQESIIVYNLRSILCVPLKVKGVLTGVIYADNRIRSGLFTESTRDLLSAFADQAAVAIENARLFESVRSTLAEVTELKNLMDDVFASIASGVLTADLGNKITFCNQAAENILGLAESELVGKSISEILPGLVSGSSDPISELHEADSRAVEVEINPVLPRRGLVSLRVNLSLLKDAELVTRGIALVLEDLTEQKRLEAQRRLFERMVAPAVIDQINADDMQLGGDRADITTLFADIHGFTGFSEQLDPEELVSVLNRYLEAIVEAVMAEHGTINKFMGDAVLAIFNAPSPQSNLTLRAVRAALNTRSRILTLHHELPAKYRLSFSIGIHYGEALLGLIGTQKRLEYTAIGDSVNTAKRIQENAGEGQVLISAAAYEQVKGQVEAREVEPVKAKGKREPLRVYEVVRLEEY